MPIQITLPDDLAIEIGKVTNNPSQFVATAVRQILRDSSTASPQDQTEQINRLAEELDKEAEEVLEFQVIP